MRSTATGSFLMEKTPDMPDDPRPEPVAMTDDEIAKLAPLKGEKSFSVRFAVNVDLEPNCKGPVPFLGPHFCELTRKQFRDLYGKSLLCRTDRIENIDAGCGPLPELPKKSSEKGNAAAAHVSSPSVEAPAFQRKRKPSDASARLVKHPWL